MQFNLADMFESVVDAVRTARRSYAEGRRLTFRAARRARQPARAPLRQPGHRAGRPRRLPHDERHRVPRDDDRAVQDPRRADQRELPVRRGGAALPLRRRRPRGRGVRHRVRRPGRGGAAEDAEGEARCSPSARPRATPCPRAPCASRTRSAAQPDDRSGFPDRSARRPVHHLHRRHDRHAQGRHVAPGGPLLRRHGRRLPGGRAARPAPRRPDPGRSPTARWSASRPRR